MMRKWFCTGLLAVVIALPALSGAARAGGDDDLGCSNATLQGDYAFSVLTIAPAPNVVVGLGTFDGRGGFAQIDYPGDGLSMNPPLTHFRTGQTGTYMVNSNCTGFMTIDIVQAGVVVTNAIVISNGGRSIHAVVAGGLTVGGMAVPAGKTRVDFWKVASDQDD